MDHFLFFGWVEKSYKMQGVQHGDHSQNTGRVWHSMGVNCLAACLPLREVPLETYPHQVIHPHPRILASVNLNLADSSFLILL